MPALLRQQQPARAEQQRRQLVHQQGQRQRGENHGGGKRDIGFFLNIHGGSCGFDFRPLIIIKRPSEKRCGFSDGLGLRRFLFGGNKKRASFRKPLFVSECQSYYRNDCLDLLAQTVPTMYFFVFRGNGCAGCPEGVLPVACFPLNVRCF